MAKRKKLIILILVMLVVSAILVFWVIVRQKISGLGQGSIYAIKDLLEDPDRFLDRRVKIHAAFVINIPFCTLMACTAENPCCNSCSHIYLKLQNWDDSTNTDLQACSEGQEILCSRVADVISGTCGTVCEFGGEPLEIQSIAGEKIEILGKTQPVEREIVGKLINLQDSSEGEYCFEIESVGKGYIPVF